MNNLSHQLLQKIQEINHNLIQDDRLTNLAQVITTKIREREIISLNEAERYIRDQNLIHENLQKIITVYNTNRSNFTPLEYLQSYTNFKEICKDEHLNCIGISVRLLKSKKVILAVLLARIDKRAADDKIKRIITKYIKKKFLSYIE